MFLSVSVAQPRTQCQAYVEPLRVLKSKANWKRYSILETVFTVSILWGWQESDWASYWFVKNCFSFNSPAFKQHTELSQETPCLGVHLHTAHPVRLLLATSLSFQLSQYEHLCREKLFFCTIPNLILWHGINILLLFFLLVKFYPCLLCPFALSHSIFLFSLPCFTLHGGVCVFSLSFSTGNVPAIQQKGAHWERLGKHSIKIRISNILLIKHLKSTVAGLICQYCEKCQF